MGWIKYDNKKRIKENAKYILGKKLEDKKYTVVLSKHFDLFSHLSTQTFCLIPTSLFFLFRK